MFVLFFYIFIVLGHENIYEAIKKRFLNSHVHSHILPDEIKKTIPIEGVETPQDEAVKFSLGNEEEKSLQQTFNDINTQVQKYVVTKFLISLASASTEGLIIWLFGVDFAIVWAVIIFALNFIPNIGSLIGIGFPLLMALVQFDSIIYVLILAAVLITVDTILGNIVEPKVFGDTLGLNPLVVLFALLLWGYIWGAIGAILSVPLTSVIKIIVSRSDSPNLKFINDLMS